MGSLIFFAKTMAITLLVVTLLQIKVDQQTLEEKTLSFVYSSSLTEPIREVAEGGVIAIRSLWNKIAGNFNTKFSESISSQNRPGQRMNINMQRSKEYIREKTQEAAEAMEREANRAARNIREEFEREGIVESSEQ